MSYNPLIKNQPDGSVAVSGSIKVTYPNTYLSASQIQTIATGSITVLTSSQLLSSNNNVAFLNIKKPLKKINTHTTLSSADQFIVVDASNGEVNITLPEASSAPFQEYNIKKADTSANPVNIIGKIINYKQKSILNGSKAIDANDFFGYSVCINTSGSIAVVGAYTDETGSTPDVGLVYVYAYDNNFNVWKEVSILSGSRANNSNDGFGSAVSINSAGDRIVVGAIYDEPSSTADVGLGYVFISGANGWSQSATLNGTRTTLNDAFGCSVTMNSAGDRIVIGAYADEPSSTSDTGLAYVFVSGAAGWSQSAMLSGSRSTQTNDYYGYSVSINSLGDRIIIGAASDEPTTGTDTGLAYIYVSSSSGWRETAILSGSRATDTNDFFGNSVSMNSTGNRVAIGAYYDEPASTLNTGIAYIFDSGSSGWTQTVILSGSKSTQTDDFFGYSVAINSAGDYVVVGAAKDEPGATTNIGLAYVYASSSTGWREISALSGSRATQTGDFFGCAVAINSAGDRVLVGAGEDELDILSGSSGLAYVYQLIGSMDGYISGSLKTQNESIRIISDASSSWSKI